MKTNFSKIQKKYGLDRKMKNWKLEDKCPNCKSKNLSKGGSDFIYSITEGREIPIQFCNDCHAEWFIELEGKSLVEKKE